jgi:signal peptidase I
MDPRQPDPAAGGEPRPHPAAPDAVDPTADASSSPVADTVTAEPAPPAPPIRPAKRQINPVLELVLILAAAVIVWYVTDGWVVKPYRIPSASMEPTLEVGDRVLVARFVYRFHDPHRGDIVVFHPPGTGDTPQLGATTEASVYFIKRIVGLPGETIEGRNHHVLICEAPNVGCHVLKEPYLHQAAAPSDFGPVQIPQGRYFMMGDNRKISDDSRFWGTLPRSYIIGEAFATYWPLNRLGTL